MMNHRENDSTQENEGKQVQQELEEQLRAFGNTMSDAFAHGFEGRGMDIGDRAFDVGKAAVHAANYGISEAGKAMRQARDSYYQSQRQAHANGGTAEQYAGMPQWARNFFASRPELTPVEKLRKCAKERYSSGVALLAVGIIFAVLFGLGAVGCLIGLGIISPAALGDVVVSTAEGGGILMTGTDYAMNTAYNVLGIVSTFNIVNIIYNCNSFCRKTCDHKCCSGAKIGSIHSCSGIFFRSIDNCNIALYLNIGTHTCQFINIFETILKNTLSHCTCSLGNSKNDCHLWLHVCWESRVWKCCHLCMMKRFGSHNTHCVIKLFHFTANFQKFCSGCFQMLWNDILYCDISFCCSRCKHKGSCLNLIRDNRILCLVEFFHTDNPDYIRTCTTDLRTHAVQKVRNIHHMWLFCCVLDNCFSLCHRSCHHNVNGCSDRYFIQINMGSCQLFCGCKNKPMFNINIGA